MKNLLPPFQFLEITMEKERRQQILHSSLFILHFLPNALSDFLKLLFAQFQLRI